MSTPSIQHVWTLHRRGINGGFGEELHGCHIVFTGADFEFTEPDIHKVLSFTPSQLPSAVPFTFPIFTYKEAEWAITVWTLPIGANGSGTWATRGKQAPDVDPQSGDFTAQAGGSIDLDKATYRAKA